MLSAERFVPFRRVWAMVAIGNSSYSLYLTHTLAIPVLAALALRLPGLNAIGAAWALLPMMGAAVVIGWLAYILFERPVSRRLQAAWRGWRTDIRADLVPIT
jgi:peptidoglycan/LPS O-acetylase OafA/YrhL